MSKKMSKKEINYFDWFVDAAKVSHTAAVMLKEMLEHTDSNHMEEKTQAIHEVEHKGDELHHELCYHLNRSFITPIEREDILAIGRYIEDTTDAIDEVSIMIDMMAVTSIRPGALQMADMIVDSCAMMVEAASEFRNFKKSKKLKGLLVEINNIEEAGDRLYHSIIKELFAKETNVLNVVRWKSIFAAMEDVLDACENVADLMEGVIMKNS
jgi:predicted phosphate transport protein (TIGR00153 family)